MRLSRPDHFNIALLIPIVPSHGRIGKEADSGCHESTSADRMWPTILWKNSALKMIHADFVSSSVHGPFASWIEHRDLKLHEHCLS